MCSGLGVNYETFQRMERELSAIREGKGACRELRNLGQTWRLAARSWPTWSDWAQCPVYESMQHGNLADQCEPPWASSKKGGRRGRHH